MTGALDMFDKVPGKPTTFPELMNVLRDIVTSINSIKRRLVKKNFQRSDKRERPSSNEDDIKGRRNAEDKTYTAVANSLEKRLHQVVQYLLYFRNTDGSFGDPMVEQSVR